MGHSKTDWERRALKAEAELQTIQPHLISIMLKGPALVAMIEAYPLLLAIAKAAREDGCKDDGGLCDCERPLCVALRDLYAAFPGGMS